ncbi:putative lipoLpqN family protein [Rhodococcus sp. MTM3W5.2]|uniref:LpqN/LpqT family lipoprotein n=1 Tax=Rhodococcus sp. MTM3W5.2 TaxID=1805827 RepID=UPI000979384D|nr:LpqN/LpqT family lipoprotein [Rhodococcus sp. MTM3W5.2]AQA24927.1 putative lipoLpqN family protein [Rhodococcus sp. MTM3W5.2]
MPDAPNPADLTIAEYLASQGIECVPSESDPSVVSVPVLPGWSELPAGEVPGAAQVLVCPGAGAEGFTPNAVLTHGRLTSAVAAGEILARAFADSRRLPGWQDVELSTGDFNGRPSAFIRGVYTVEPWNLDATTRYVVTDGEQGQYLTQLTVTSLASRDGDLATDVAVLNLGLAISQR